MPTYNDNPLDHQVNTELMRVCKCIIPYLDRNVQKNVAVGIKFLELVNTITAFSEDNISNDFSLMRQGNWEDDLLYSVRSNLSSEKAYLIDALIKLKEFRSIVETKDNTSSFESPNISEPVNPNPFFNDINTPPKSNQNTTSPTNILQMLSPLLDDNQKQILNLLSTFLGNK